MNPHAFSVGSRWRVIAFAAALALLAGCQTPPSSQQAAIPGKDPATLMAEAEALSPPQQQQQQLQAAQLYAANGDNAKALNVLAGIDHPRLPGADLARYSDLYARLAMAEDAYFLARRILTHERLERQLPQLPPALVIPLRERRADVFALLGESTVSIEERVKLAPLLTAEVDQVANQETIWQTLMSIPLERLRGLAQTAANAQLQGWYQLAAISKDTQANLEQQLSQVNRWIARWPEHPASLRLPSDLQLLKELIANRPQQVALLLPTAGRLAGPGQAIRDGFMAAYFHSRQQGGEVPRLRFYDTSAGNIEQLYDQAVAEGAAAVIGPLDKNAVAALSTRDRLPVPTLALNYPDDANEAAENLFLFGLAVEDEAAQAAEQAWLEGHRYALILAPEASWGRRAANTFYATWQEQGGTVVDTGFFAGGNDAYANVVKRTLHIDRSQQRARLIQQILGQGVEFEPRRRQDMDMIFLAGQPRDARLIKPILAFQFAGDVPVYASSQVYGGEPNPENDRDLNGIRFLAIPWLFDEDNAVKNTVQAEANPAPAFQRLYALGADAFRLFPRLEQLRRVPELRFYGNTGALQLVGQRIQRHLLWAHMRNGTARPLPLVVSTEYVE